MGSLSNRNGSSKFVNNSLMPECIRVEKVYDWVSDVNSYKNKTVIPGKDDCKESCFEKVNEAMKKHHKLRVECISPDLPKPFPLEKKPEIENTPNKKCHKKDGNHCDCMECKSKEKKKSWCSKCWDCCGKYDRTPWCKYCKACCGKKHCKKKKKPEKKKKHFDCEILEIENGNPGVVRVLWTVWVQVRIIDEIKNKVLCTFEVPIQFDDEFALCVPAPLNKNNISCRITKVDCKPTKRVLLGNIVQLQIDVCKEIKVQAEVKLEVMSKFCQPRENDIDITRDIQCPTFDFPEQCPEVFPRQNCDCQAFVATMSQNATVTFNLPNFTASPTPNSTMLNATICDDCTIAGSALSYIFRDLRNNPAVNQSFTFTATELNMPDCVTPPGFEIAMELEGQGMVQFTDAATPDRQVRFSLALNESIGMGMDRYRFRLFDGNTTIYDTGDVMVPDSEITVQDCVTFQDITINRP